MKGRGTVRGILIAGSDGHEYLLGFTRTGEMGKEFFLWTAVGEALTSFPPIPTWPTWTG